MSLQLIKEKFSSTCTNIITDTEQHDVYCHASALCPSVCRRVSHWWYHPIGHNISQSCFISGTLTEHTFDQKPIYRYNDIIMRAMASQITCISNVYPTVCSGIEQIKHLNFTSLTFVLGIHQWLVNSPHKGPVMRKCFPLMASSCYDQDKILWALSVKLFLKFWMHVVWPAVTLSASCMDSLSLTWNNFSPKVRILLRILAQIRECSYLLSQKICFSTEQVPFSEKVLNFLYSFQKYVCLAPHSVFVSWWQCVFTQFGMDVTITTNSWVVYFLVY